MSPGAVNNDGILDICLIENSNTLTKTLSVILKVLVGKHIYSPRVKTWRAKEVVVNAEKPMAFLCDGEICQKASEFKIEILPSALNVITAQTNAEAQDHRANLVAAEKMGATQNHGENDVVSTEKRIS